MAGVVEEHVGGTQVAVDDAVAVHEGQRPGHGAPDARDVRPAVRAHQALAQVAAGHVLHQHDERVVALADGVDPHDPRVLEPRQLARRGEGRRVAQVALDDDPLAPLAAAPHEVDAAARVLADDVEELEPPRADERAVRPGADRVLDVPPLERRDQRLAERPGVGVARLGRLGQRALDDRAEVVGDRRPLERPPAGARQLAGDDPVEDHAERVDVGLRPDGVERLPLLGGHEGPRAEGHRLARRAGVLGDLLVHRRAHRGDAEVADLHLPGAGDEDVRRLDVAVDDAVAVGVGEAPRRLHQDRQRPLAVERALGQQLLQRRPVHVLHHEVGAARRGAAVDHLDDVGVVEAGEDAGFLLEQLHHLRLLEQLGAQDLHGHAPAEGDLLRLPDLGEAAARQLADQTQPAERRRLLRDGRRGVLFRPRHAPLPRTRMRHPARAPQSAGR